MGIADEVEHRVGLTCILVAFPMLIANKMAMQIATIWLVTLYDRHVRKFSGLQRNHQLGAGAAGHCEQGCAAEPRVGPAAA